MIRLVQSRQFAPAVAAAAMFLSLNLTANAQNRTTGAAPSTTQLPLTVDLHWGARAGASRYRLQVANDAAFTDVVLDRVVRGLQYQLSDLPPGRYFWRVAPLGS